MLNLFTTKPMTVIAPDQALPGRAAAIPTAQTHFLSGLPLKSAVPDGHEVAMFGMGCFWGVERIFWQRPGVWLSMVGYAAGHTPNPTYQEVCTGQTGHTIADDQGRVAHRCNAHAKAVGGLGIFTDGTHVHAVGGSIDHKGADRYQQKGDIYHQGVFEKHLADYRNVGQSRNPKDGKG